jgi:hypothetical protein
MKQKYASHAEPAPMVPLGLRLLLVLARHGTHSFDTYKKMTHSPFASRNIGPNCGQRETASVSERRSGSS